MTKSREAMTKSREAMRKLLAMVAASALLAGCWTVRSGSAEVAADFPQQDIRTIAILPVLNMSEAQMAPWSTYGATALALGREKKFEVLPMSKVMATLRQGGGAAAWTQAMNRVNMGREISDDQLAAMARALEADALFLQTVVSFHQTTEEGVGVSAQGGTYAQEFPVSVVSARAMLWGARARRVLWRDEAQTRYYPSPDREGMGDIQAVVTMATRELLEDFPENTWAPYQAPAPSPRPTPPGRWVPFPQPTPVASYAPFPVPADPQEQR